MRCQVRDVCRPNGAVKMMAIWSVAALADNTASIFKKSRWRSCAIIGNLMIAKIRWKKIR